MVTYDVLMTYVESVPPFGVFREKARKTVTEHLTVRNYDHFGPQRKARNRGLFFKVSLPEVL